MSRGSIGHPSKGSSETTVRTDLVDIRPLKRTVQGLPAGNPVRALIIEEPDRLPMSEYGAKILVWFRLLKILQE